MAIPEYATEMKNAVAGQLLGTNEHVVLTRIAKTDIAFGAALYGDAADGNKVESKNAGTQVFLGVAAFNQTIDGCYLAKTAVSVVNKGMVYVKVNAAVKANQPVFVTKTDGTFVDKAGESAAVEVNAMYLEDGASGAIVPILLK